MTEHTAMDRTKFTKTLTSKNHNIILSIDANEVNIS